MAQVVLEGCLIAAAGVCSGVRESATACIEELHQQLGSIVMAKLEALNAKPAQLKQLQARFGQLAISGEIVQDFPLFQPVTAEPSVRRPGSVTSRSDSSTQVGLLSTLELAWGGAKAGGERGRVHSRFVIDEGQGEKE